MHVNSKLSIAAGFEDDFMATEAPGRGRYVDIYFNINVGNSEPVKMYFATADLWKLGWSTRWNRCFGNNVKKIWVRRSGCEDEKMKITGCFEANSGP